MFPATFLAELEASVDRPLWEYFDLISGTSTGGIIAIGLGLCLLLLNLLLNRFNFAPAALAPKFEKLNPIAGLKGIFSKTTLYNFARLMVYFPSVAIIAYLIVTDNISNVLNAAACGLGCLAQIFPTLIIRMVILILIVLLLLAVLDFKLQNMLFESQNKMSKDDVKREMKGSEGDPQIKGKRKEIAKDDMELPSPKDVTHVIYSNAHLVAILYEEGVTPFVVTKVQGDRVPALQAKFRRMGVRCVNLPSVARQF